HFISLPAHTSINGGYAKHTYGMFRTRCAPSRILKRRDCQEIGYDQTDDHHYRKTKQCSNQYILCLFVVESTRQVSKTKYGFSSDQETQGSVLSDQDECQCQ